MTPIGVHGSEEIRHDPRLGYVTELLAFLIATGPKTCIHGLSEVCLQHDFLQSGGFGLGNAIFQERIGRRNK